MVQAEADFLNYLQGANLSVPQVIPTETGDPLASLADGFGGHFITALFSKAPGRPPRAEDWTPTLFERMGRYLGRLHALSRSFVPSSVLNTRFDIQQDFVEMQAVATKWLPAQDEVVLESYRQLTATISALPKSKESYGLSHVDFHRGNFFIAESGEICLFDFDDCQYAWYVYDIAMALFYAVPSHCTSPEQLGQAQAFLMHFWRAYCQENDLDPTWLLQIPEFLRLREIDLYFAIHRSMDMDNLDAWCTDYMRGRRENILAGIPYCPIDYTKIA